MEYAYGLQEEVVRYEPLSLIESLQIFDLFQNVNNSYQMVLVLRGPNIFFILLTFKKLYHTLI